MKTTGPIQWAAAILLACILVDANAADEYPLSPDSLPQEGVPKGMVLHREFANSSIFPGTVRDYWIYVPAQYNADKPASLMVIQDGKRRADEWRVPVVFDNLIHKREMPVTIGVFIDPGVVPAVRENALPRYNRSFEYDSMGDRYARFLLQEILPAVSKEYNISTNAADRAIGGASSGAICAWTVAWERPESFQRVFSTIGTYVGLRGGNDYPVLIRKSEPKPIRVFLQDGSNDLNIYGGDWWVANQDMLSALRFAGYDVAHAWGDGGHNGRHGAAVFPEAMRWLWRGHPEPVAIGKESRQPVMQIVSPTEPWELVGEGYRFTEGPAVNEAGELFFTDIPNNRIYRVREGVELFAENTGGANGLMFGPDGRLYACANGNRKIVAYTMDGRVQTVVDDVECNDLVLSKDGGYFTDPSNKRVWHFKLDGDKKIVDTGIERPNGVILSPDQTLLLVSDTRTRWVYSFQVQPDGSLANKQEFFHLHLPDDRADSGADGLTVDTQGRLYVTTHMGIQVCDQAGRVIGIINKPQRAWLSNIVFGGPELNILFVTCGDKVYRRKTQAKGVLPWGEPVLPPQPRL